MRQFRTAATIILFVPSLIWGATTFNVDGVHSRVEFGVRHLVITTVKGHFAGFEGVIVYDEKNPAQWEIRGKIDASSVNTGDEERDTHLRSPDFLDVEKYPDIIFQSSKVRRNGDQFICTGNFTMHGITREVEIPFKLTGPITDPWGNDRIGLESSWTVDRKEYGITWSKAMDGGGLVLGDEVRIELNIEGVHSKE